MTDLIKLFASQFSICTIDQSESNRKIAGGGGGGGGEQVNQARNSIYLHTKRFRDDDNLVLFSFTFLLSFMPD